MIDNVRWTRQFYVNTAIPNTFPILFYRQPQVRVFEILKGHQITPPEPIRTIESGSLSLLPTPLVNKKYHHHPTSIQRVVQESYQQKKNLINLESFLTNLKILLKQKLSLQVNHHLEEEVEYKDVLHLK